MRAIVSVTLDWGIGLNGGLAVRNSADICFFKDMTTGGTVVMGRNTYQSLPNGALPERRNVVVTTDREFAPERVEVAHSVPEAMCMVAHTPPDKVWLIGGGKLYSEMLKFCDEAFVTFNYIRADADTYFPNLDEDPSWRLYAIIIAGYGGGFDYQMRRYKRIEGTNE